MTLRKRWTLSIAAILILFGLNLGVYFWGSDRQESAILHLKEALDRKDIALEIKNTVKDRQRDALVLEPLLAAGTDLLGPEERSRAYNRLNAVTERIDQLAALSDSQEVGAVRDSYGKLRRAWLEIYDVTGPIVPYTTNRDEEVTGSDSGPSGYHALYNKTLTDLRRLESAEKTAAEQAEARFGAVSRLTHRVTLGIFVLTTLLTVGIAVWFSRFLRRAFGRYVTDEVVSSVLERPEGLRMGGEKRRITVMMADLRGFTSMSERLEPEQVVTVVNNFLGTMTEIIIASGGTIDEFIGDAILVLFGAPVASRNHARTAVDCALQMQLAMAQVNEKNRGQDLPEVEMGIGIHTGDAVVGNIGSEKRTKYGAVGPTMNLAGRIESETVGGQILISETTRSEVGDELRIRGRLQIHPKGLEESVELFDITGIVGQVERYLDEWEESLIPLAESIPIRFTRLKGKKHEATWCAAEITALSSRAAEIHSAEPLEILTNLKVEMVSAPGAAATPGFYAKVVSGQDERPDRHRIRFTSLPPEVSSLIEELLLAAD